MNPDGGAAIPVQIVTGTEIEGGAAIPVYGYATLPTDGRMVEGRPARRVVVLSAADLVQNGGRYILEGRPFALPVMTAPADSVIEGNIPIAVYPVNSWPTVPTVTPWYLLGGLTLAEVVGAYQPKGAVSLAASYINLAHPGTNNAAPGVAPTFNAATGWSFDGTKWLDTGILPAQGYSMLVQFTNGAGTAAIAGMDGTGSMRIHIYTSYTGDTYYRNGASQAVVGGGYIAGNAGVAGGQGYKNGLAHGPAFDGTWSGPTAISIYIGTMNNNGAPETGWSGTIAAVLICNTILTPLQVGLIATAMAAL